MKSDMAMMIRDPNSMLKVDYVIGGKEKTERALKGLPLAWVNLLSSIAQWKVQKAPCACGDLSPWVRPSGM